MRSILRGIIGIFGALLFTSAGSAQGKAADYIAAGDSALAELRGMDALKSYQSALELDSNNVLLLSRTITLIKDLFDSKDIVYGVGKSYGEVADRYYSRLYSLDSNSQEVALARAQLAEIDYMSVHSHDPQKVTHRYFVIRSCLRAIPKSAECAAMLAGWYMEQAHESPELRLRAINTYLKDKIITPSDSAILMQISWDSTMKYLELSQLLEPENMGYAFRLAEVYFSRGDTIKAKELFKKVDAMPVRHLRDPHYKRSLANYKARLRIKN